MKKFMLILAVLLLFGGQIACSISPPPIPTIEINIPTIEVGEMQHKQETIPLEGADSATVAVVFGAGDLNITAGEDADQLLSGDFYYNVADWEPQVYYLNGLLTIEQGESVKDWGFPTGDAHNEWQLSFSPTAALAVDIKAGAGKGDLDFTGLQLTRLNLDLGAGNFDVRFGEPNQADMSNLKLNAGTSKLEVSGIGYASPKEMHVQGGVGDIDLDLSGPWARSADVWVTAGVGAVTMRLPADVGVQVEVEGGVSSVDVSGFHLTDGAYVNDAWGKAEIELHIYATTGIGSLHLIEVSNEQ